MPRRQRLPRRFLLEDDVVGIAKSLLGKVLCTHIDDTFTAGIIVEAEAYRGPEDRASHAFGMRRTARTEPMYARGGTAYIYLCYGIHHLFNIVTAREGIPHAILIRAIEPQDGIDAMLARRGLDKPAYKLTSGPGALASALGLTTAVSGTDMFDRASTVWLEDRGIRVQEKSILARPRVGVAYAGEDADLLWRFSIRDNPWAGKVK